MTQREIVLDYLKKHGSITQREGVIELNIMDVSKRINELEKLGVSIIHHRHNYLNKHGEPRHYTVYMLEAEYA